jgi:hypothetical protein
MVNFYWYWQIVIHAFTFQLMSQLFPFVLLLALTGEPLGRVVLCMSWWKLILEDWEERFPVNLWADKTVENHWSWRQPVCSFFGVLFLSSEMVVISFCWFMCLRGTTPGVAWESSTRLSCQGCESVRKDMLIDWPNCGVLMCYEF